MQAPPIARSSRLLWLLVSAVALAGCKKSPPAPGSATVEAAPPPAPAVDAAAQARDQKLRAAIACINGLSANVDRAREGYARTVPAATGPTAAMTVYVGRVAFEDCPPALEAAAALTPADPDLDAAASAYVAAVTSLVPIVNDASDYYAEKRNHDDGAAKGKELHPRLIDGFARFAAADEALRKVVAARNRARKEAHLAELAKDPRDRGEYLVARLMLVAEDVVTLADAPLDALDLAALSARVDELGTALHELDARIADTAQPKIPGVVQLQSAARYYLTAALDLVRRKREGTGYTASEREDLARGSTTINGSTPQLVDLYNRLVSASNSR